MKPVSREHFFCAIQTLASSRRPVTKALVTIDPVETTTVFDVAGAKVGYLDLRTFISTADDQLDVAFAEFGAQNVTALVVDLRYNGGGLVSTAELLADLIGGFIANGQILSETRFNSAKSAFNEIRALSAATGLAVVAATGRLHHDGQLRVRQRTRDQLRYFLTPW